MFFFFFFLHRMMAGVVALPGVVGISSCTPEVHVICLE